MSSVLVANHFLFVPLFLQTKQIGILTEKLQGFVDPFDLDVFRPYIAANLDRQLMRSTVSNLL